MLLIMTINTISPSLFNQQSFWHLFLVFQLSYACWNYLFWEKMLQQEYDFSLHCSLFFYSVCAFFEKKILFRFSKLNFHVFLIWLCSSNSHVCDCVDLKSCFFTKRTFSELRSFAFSTVDGSTIYLFHTLQLHRFLFVRWMIIFCYHLKKLSFWLSREINLLFIVFVLTDSICLLHHTVFTFWQVNERKRIIFELKFLCCLSSSSFMQHL